jgi:DNA-binding transcriptional regulator YiaG
MVQRGYGAFLSRLCTLGAMDAVKIARVRAICRSGAGQRVREAANLTRAEVGRSSGVSGAAVSRWEDHSRVPTGPEALRYLRLLEKLSVMTGVSLDDHEPVAS